MLCRYTHSVQYSTALQVPDSRRLGGALRHLKPGQCIVLHSGAFCGEISRPLLEPDALEAGDSRQNRHSFCLSFGTKHRADDEERAHTQRITCSEVAITTAAYDCSTSAAFQASSPRVGRESPYSL
jgi:hypothetical protein